MAEKEITLQEQMPESFYKLFASKYRNRFIDYIVAIYDDMSRTTLRLKSGRTKAECRDIINAMPVSGEETDGEDLPDMEYDVYDNRFFVCLVKWGWLTSKYDSECGEDIYVIPEYARLFVEVFKALKRSRIETKAAISTVYANIVTYRLREKNIMFLQRAYEELLRLNTSLSSSAEMFEKKTYALLQHENSISLLETWLQSYGETGMDTTEQGSFRYFYGMTQNDVRELLNEVEEVIDSQETFYDDGVEPEGNVLLLDTLSEIMEELRRTERLFEDNLDKSRKMCIRAIEKAKYLQARDEQEGMSTLMTLIGVLAKEKAEGKNDRISLAMNTWGPLPCVRSIFSAKPYEPRNMKVDPEKVLVMKEDASSNIQGDPERYRPKYTAKELKEFEKERTIEGKFIADETTIKTAEDLDRYTYLLLRTMGTSQAGATIVYADSDDDEGYVRVSDGLGFTKVIWEVEEKN